MSSSGDATHTLDVQPKKDPACQTLKREHDSYDDGDLKAPRLASGSSVSRGMPVCGSSVKRHRDECDGKAKCGPCREAGWRTCVYYFCDDGIGCRDEHCDFLHPDQWVEEVRIGRRLVAGINHDTGPYLRRLRYEDRGYWHSGARQLPGDDT